MGNFTITHVINCDAETFWKVFLDKAFTEQLFREALGFPQFQIVDQKDTGTQVTRRISGVPKMNVPGPVAKLLGANFGYVEDGVLDKAKGTWTWKITPSSLADKLRQEGSMRLEPMGTDKVQRIASMVNEAKVFGLGGLIESATEKGLREGWEASATFMNQYLAKQKP